MNIYSRTIFSFISYFLLVALSSGIVQADETAEQQTRNPLFEKLHEEKQKQIGLIYDLQRAVQREKMQLDLPNILEKEKLALKNESDADAKLSALETAHHVVTKRIDSIVKIPLFMQHVDELIELAARKESMQHQRETFVSKLIDPSTDQRIQRLDQQFREVNDRIREILGITDENDLDKIQKLLRDPDVMNLLLVQKQIAEQHILVDILRKKYEVLRRERYDHSDILADITDWQFQIDWANKIVEQIDSRLLALQLLPNEDTVKKPEEPSQLDRAYKILGQFESRIRSLSVGKEEIPTPSDQPVDQDQLRQINERLDRIETLLQTLLQKEQAK